MHDSSRTYFEERVLTAPPERLQFMLIEAALGAARRAEKHLVADRALQANVELAQAEAILADILGGFKKEEAPQLVERTAAVYAFVIRRLTDAHLSGEVQPVRDAVRVLEVEYETWRQVCEGATGVVDAAPAAVPAPHRPPVAHFTYDAALPSEGFSAEA
jgi:flagellar biosynthetic protein FliS